MDEEPQRQHRSSGRKIPAIDYDTLAEAYIDAKERLELIQYHMERLITLIYGHRKVEPWKGK